MSRASLLWPMPMLDRENLNEPAHTDRPGEKGEHSVRVAHLLGDLRPYRKAFYDSLATRVDIDVTLYAGYPNPGLGAPEVRPDVAVTVIDVDNRYHPGRPYKVLWQRGALDMLRSDAEVIVCQELVSNLSVWMIRLLHRRAGKRLVLMGFFYRPEGSGLRAIIRDALRRFLRRSASALVAYTEQGRAELIAEGVAEDTVFVTWNTLDTEYLIALANEAASSAGDVRHRLGIPPNAVVLAFVGRLRRKKRIEVAIETVRQLDRRSDVSVVLLVIGDGEERERLEARAAGAPVLFVGQTYEDRDLAEYLSIASLLVMPGSVGLTCVLGFANGLPVVTTDADATVQTPEFAYVRHDENGIVVEAPRPELYSERIENLLSDEAQMNRLRAGAIATARSLSMERMVDAYVAAARRGA